MARGDQEDCVRRIRDRLSYVLLYAPDFPSEDATTVEKEFDTLLTLVHTLWNEIQDAERRHWLDLLGRELVDARGTFLAGDVKNGCALIQSTEDRLVNWQSSKAMDPSYIVDPSGVARKVGE